MLNSAVIDWNWLQTIDWKTLVIGGIVVGIPLNLLSGWCQSLMAKGFSRSKTYFSKSRQNLAMIDLKLIEQFKSGEKDVHLWAIGLLMLELVMAGLSIFTIIVMLVVPDAFSSDDTFGKTIMLMLLGLCLSIIFLITQSYLRIVKRYDEYEEFAKEVAGFSNPKIKKKS